MKRLLALFLGLIFLASCERKEKPEGLIERQKMVTVLTDVHMVSGYSATVMDIDTMKQELANYMDMVYKKHQIDSVKFKKSLQYYSREPKMLNEMYDEVLRNLEAKEKDIKLPRIE